MIDPAAPALTVAVPTCNGARHLAEALRGILAQDAPFDLLICDDRSDDDTLAVARAEAGDRARVEVNAERLGLAGNWNRCVALSRSPFVAIFHQDDLMRPGHLAAHAATFGGDAGGTLGMACGAADVVDDSGRPVLPSAVDPGGLGPADRAFSAGELTPHLLPSNPLRCSTVTLRASAHAAIGGFDPSYRYVVDWDFWLRLSRRYAVAWLARPSVAIRWHLASETHRFRGGTDDLDEASRLLDGLFEVDGPSRSDLRRFRRPADLRLARAFLNRAYDAGRRGDGDLLRRCLVRGLRINPRIVVTIATDPRLAIRLAAGWLGQRSSGRGSH